MNKMDSIVLKSSLVMIAILNIIGIFGYLTFADNLEKSILSKSSNADILECDYKGSFKIQLARIFVIITIIASTLPCILPAKETYFTIIKNKSVTD